MYLVFLLPLWFGGFGDLGSLFSCKHAVVSSFPVRDVSPLNPLPLGGRLLKREGSNQNSNLTYPKQEVMDPN